MIMKDVDLVLKFSQNQQSPIAVLITEGEIFES